jgi:hypothetical protein
MDIIVDIDGTLANIEHRLHFIRKPYLHVIPGTENVKREDYEAWKAWKPDYDAFFDACDKDTPIEPVLELLRAVHGDEWDSHNLLWATGRPERVREKTSKWLEAHAPHIPRLVQPKLYMRATGDHRPDHVVKRELLAQMRADGFDPKLAIDDRQQVVDMWRAEGLICAQVAKGDY